MPVGTEIFVDPQNGQTVGVAVTSGAGLGDLPSSPLGRVDVRVGGDGKSNGLRYGFNIGT